MLARALTHALVGLEARCVEVEAHLQRGVPGFSIVGLPDKACQEAKERVRSGIASAELEWPLKRITVNLAPAGLRKEGSGFDLPIALAVLAASRQIPPDRLAEHAALGELALDGRVRAVPGAIVAAEAARRAGVARLICAPESAPEAALAGVEPVPVRHLAEAGRYLRGMFDPPPVDAPKPSRNGHHPDLRDVRGQERARRALELAAAGRHNLLLAGPPGTGKTMLARRLPGILPHLRLEEALEVTRIHSVAGRLPPGRPLLDRPPFRAPHHTSSTAAVVGGGPGPRPGEVSLAHRGVLLLDELGEFHRPTLEALRQPLEDGFVTVSRVQGQCTFPARILLVGTMNVRPKPLNQAGWRRLSTGTFYQPRSGSYARGRFHAETTSATCHSPRGGGPRKMPDHTDVKHPKNVSRDKCFADLIQGRPPAGRSKRCKEGPSMKKVKFSAVVALIGALIALMAIAPPASAAPAAGSLTLPATCTDAEGDPVSCTLQLVGFTTQNGTVAAVLRLTNNVTGQTTTITAPLGAVTQPQQGGTCTLLELTIQPIDLFLLGLHLHTDTIHLVLTAERGTLLGDLLCGLFFGNPGGAATTLNQLLRQGMIQVA